MGNIFLYSSLVILFSVIGFLIYWLSHTLANRHELMKKLREFERINQNLADKNEVLQFSLEKQIYEEVAKKRKEDYILIQQSRLAAMGEIITSMSNHWREPLNSLSLLIQDVQEALHFGEINDQYINEFTKESMLQIKHMSRTINDFRKFYKLDKEKCSFSIPESVEDALAIFSSNLSKHYIQIEFEFSGQHLAYGYPHQFRQAVINILTNTRDAFAHSDRKNRTLHIEVEEMEDSTMTTFTDNAGGITPSLLEKVFDPYFTTKSFGAGLGLYIAKVIVGNMQGNIYVENTGDGFRLSLSLPKSRKASEAELALSLKTFIF